MAQRDLLSQLTAQRVASAIYGLIITGAVLAGITAEATRREAVFEVLIVVIVYWTTEQYAEYLGLRLTSGRPGWAELRAEFRSTLTMIQATLVPLAVLVIAEVSGASVSDAVTLALATTVVALTVLVTALSRVAGMSWRSALLSGAVAAGLGAALVVLKAYFVHH